MTAVVYRGINDLRVKTVPVPRIRSNELLVQITVCEIYPTDIKKIQYGTVAPPRIFGHETAGIIVRVGARVRGFREGERVALHHHVPCRQCHYCLHRAYAQCATYRRTGITAGFEPAGGGYAQYVRVMPFVLPGVVKIPQKNSLVEGAMLEPVNTVLKAVRRLALLPGDRVWVAGQGPIGLMFTRILALKGVKVLATDLMEPRLKLAAAWGAAKTARGDDDDLALKVHRWTRGLGLDAAVLAVPVDRLVKQAQGLVRGGGQVLLFAHTVRGHDVPVDLGCLCVDEKDLIGSYSSDVTLQRAVASLVFGRKLDVRALISHQLPLERTDEAVRLAANPSADSMKIVVNQRLE